MISTYFSFTICILLLENFKLHTHQHTWLTLYLYWVVLVQRLVPLRFFICKMQVLMPSVASSQFYYEDSMPQWILQGTFHIPLSCSSYSFPQLWEYWLLIAHSWAALRNCLYLKGALHPELNSFRWICKMQVIYPVSSRSRTKITRKLHEQVAQILVTLLLFPLSVVTCAYGCNGGCLWTTFGEGIGQVWVTDELVY
jgi:hypothetical protein